MPVIRCQACGKPNPDFLDVCQYCEARLKPMGDLGPIGSPGAADETLIARPATPPPASDAPAGSMMDRLRSMEAGKAAAPAEPEPEFDDEPDEAPPTGD